jgi:hypothetical protein
MDSSTIFDAVRSVTKDWTRQKTREIRHRAAAANRHEAMTRTRRITIKEVAWAVMDAAYMKASDNGTLPAAARQVMYAARPDILVQTGAEQLDDQYFTQTLLPDYMAEHPGKTADWEVVFHARGHFAEPHTNLVIPLGTLNVRGYIAEIRALDVGELFAQLGELQIFATRGPQHCFGAILFVEKEGFLPLFQRVELAARHDLAIMSTKGLSVTASRALVETLCSTFDVPLLVLHDFDKSGFSILGTLQRTTRRYAFRRRFKVIDLGLRLEDIADLPSEPVFYGTTKTGKIVDPGPNLLENGATDEEVQFIRGELTDDGYIGERVELNAFTSRAFVDWLEAKLEHHGVRKIVPDADTLEIAYRRTVAARHFAEHAKPLTEAADRIGAEVALPLRPPRPQPAQARPGHSLARSDPADRRTKRRPGSAGPLIQKPSAFSCWVEP